MPVWFVVLLVAASSIGAGYFFARYFLKRARLEPSHKGLLLGAFSMAGFFLLYFALKHFGIDLLRGAPNRVFQAILALTFLSLAARALLARLRSGPTLADLGPSPLRTMFLVMGVFVVALGIGGLIAQGFSAGQGAVSISQGILFLTLGTLHNQIRDDGVYCTGGLLPWKRIARYEWKDGSMLLLSLRRPMWWQDRVQVPVPPTLVNPVDRWMSQHVSATLA